MNFYRSVYLVVTGKFTLVVMLFFNKNFYSTDIFVNVVQLSNYMHIIRQVNNTYLG